MAACLLLFVLPIQVAAQEFMHQKIYSDSNHNAFTSLIKFKNHYYCAFRSGERHVYGRDGIIKILVSSDGEAWKHHGEISLQGFDLRDPKLSVTPKGRIMVLMGGSVYRSKELVSQKTHVSFSDPEGNDFSDPVPIKLLENLASSFDWLWRVTWHRGTAYGVLYQRGRAGTMLVSSKDGISYSRLTDLVLDGRPNEATIRFTPQDQMLIMHRREEADQMGYWGISPHPYVDWQWKPMNFRLGGPDFCVLDTDQILAGTRLYHTSSQSVGLLSGNISGQFEILYEFESQGDCSYPSFIVEPTRILMSFYATRDGSTDVYLAILPMEDLVKK